MPLDEVPKQMCAELYTSYFKVGHRCCLNNFSNTFPHNVHGQIGVVVVITASGDARTIAVWKFLSPN